MPGPYNTMIPAQPPPNPYGTIIPAQPRGRRPGAVAPRAFGPGARRRCVRQSAPDAYANNPSPNAYQKSPNLSAQPGAPVITRPDCIRQATEHQ